MMEKWIESDGVPLNKCPECGAFPEDPYDVECRGEAHPDREGPEFEEVLYVPKALADVRIQELEREVATYRSVLELITRIPEVEIRGKKPIGRYGVHNGHRKAVSLARQALEGGEL